MKNQKWVIPVIIVAAILIMVMVFSGTWNTLNKLYQDTKGGKAQYGAALDLCSQKIEGVWAIADQYMKHESQTFKDVTLARSGYQKAAEDYKSAEAKGDTEGMTKSAMEAQAAALSFQIQVEAYPDLKASETTKENIRNMEESVNEIKTALDDWIYSIKQYNTYRGGFFPSIIGGLMGQFPSEIKYYEGTVDELDIDSLNPQN